MCINQVRVPQRAPPRSSIESLEFMDPVVTRPRTLAFIASVCWWMVALPLGPTIGKLLFVPRLSVPILGTWVLLASLSLAVLIVELLRAVVARWNTWDPTDTTFSWSWQLL
jgi:hypothetical protein